MWRFSLTLILLIASVSPALAQGVLVRVDCNTIPLSKRISGQTVCWDASANKWKYWNGAAFTDATGGTVSHTTGAIVENSVVVGGPGGSDVKTVTSPGQTNTVLHGNPSGPPSFGSVNLATDITGNLPVSNLGGGTNASSTAVWVGDGFWKTVTGVTNRTTVAQNSTTLTISGPQDIGTGSSPAFTGLTISGQAAASGNNCVQIDASGVVTKTGTACGAGGGGAPSGSKYLIQVADGSLPSAQVMGALGTGLVKNTTTTGVQSIYTGTTCSAGNAVLSLDASGAATCTAIGGTVSNSGTLTDKAIILGAGTIVVRALGSLGTTTTVLHGAAAGDPTFGAVSLTADVSGVLPVANGGSGAATLTGLVKGNGTSAMTAYGGSSCAATQFVNAIDGAGMATCAVPAGGGGGTSPAQEVNGFRLTLESGNSNSSTDQANKSTLYLTPHNHNRIALFDGVSAWTVYTTAEISIALSGLASNRPYDVFVFASGATPTLELTSWSNGTTRSTALVRQDGVLVRSGTTTRRYVGTIYATAATQTQDTVARRLVWNYYHRLLRPAKKEYNTVHTYNLTTPRQVDGDVANQVDFILGFSDNIPASIYANITVDNNEQGFAYMCLNCTNTTSTNEYLDVSNLGAGSSIRTGSTVIDPAMAIAAGYNFIAMVEATNGVIVSFNRVVVGAALQN